MRMTNEEFQAEVFRRSAAYQRQRTKRIRFMTGAAAFAGCLVLTVGVGAPLMLRTNQGSFTAKLDSAEDSASYLANEAECADAAADAPEMSEAADYSGDKDSLNFDVNSGIADSGVPTQGSADSVNRQESSAKDPKKKGGNSAGNKSDQQESSAVDPAAKHGVFVQKTEEEVLERYGLDALPETLGGIPLMKMYNLANYEDQKPGFIVSETEPDRVLSDENTLVYSANEDSSQQLKVMLFTAKGDDAPVSYTVSSNDPENREETAAFTFSGLGVRIKAYHTDHDLLETVVADLTEYLKEHRKNG